MGHAHERHARRARAGDPRCQPPCRDAVHDDDIEPIEIRRGPQPGLDEGHRSIESGRRIGHPSLVQVAAGERARRTPRQQADAQHRPAARQATRSDEPTEGVGVLVHPDTERLGTGPAQRLGELGLRPAGEHLDGDGLGVVGTDQVEVLAVQPLVDGLQRGVEHVEVADHPTIVELLALDEHLDAVVVLVQLSLGPLDAGHDVLGAQADRRTDLEHGISCTPGRHGAVPPPGRRWRRTPWRPPRRRSCGSPGVCSGSDPSRATVSACRRRRSQRADSRAGIVETCVLRIVSRRRWKAPPSGRLTSRVPYHDATSAVPSWASRPSASPSTAGLPETSITRPTPSRQPASSIAASRRRARRRLPTTQSRPPVARPGGRRR